MEYCTSMVSLEEGLFEVVLLYDIVCKCVYIQICVGILCN